MKDCTLNFGATESRRNVSKRYDKIELLENHLLLELDIQRTLIPAKPGKSNMTLEIAFMGLLPDFLTLLYFVNCNFVCWYQSWFLVFDKFCLKIILISMNIWGPSWEVYHEFRSAILDGCLLKLKKWFLIDLVKSKRVRNHVPPHADWWQKRP